MNKIISIKLPILATLVMAIALTLSCTSGASNNGSGGGDDGGSCSLDALDGVWDFNGYQVTISGSIGVVSALPDPTIKLGEQVIKGLKSTGNLTWSGQELGETTEENGVIVDEEWVDVLFTMSADGQKLTEIFPYGQTVTYTRNCGGGSISSNEQSSSSVESQSSSSGIPFCSQYPLNPGCVATIQSSSSLSIDCNPYAGTQPVGGTDTEYASDCLILKSSSSAIFNNCLPSCYKCNESGLCRGVSLDPLCVGLVAPEYYYSEPLPPDGILCPIEPDKSSSSANDKKCGEKEYNNETHFCDSRDNQVYKFVDIGTQIWMAENLNYDVPDNDTDVCYDKDPANCTKYGRLYNWETAKANTTCPNGWFLPSSEEWQTLVDFAGGSNIAGKKLKAKSGWNNDEGKSGNGTDDYGFSALPGGGSGYSSSFGDFFNVGISGQWWSTREGSADDAYTWDLYNFTNAVLTGQSTKSILHSVRCVKHKYCADPLTPGCGNPF